MHSEPTKHRWHSPKQYFKPDDNDDALRDIQAYLVRFQYLAESYSPGTLDAATSGALQAFQKQHDLKSTGHYDEATAEAMDRLRCGCPAVESTPFSLLALDDERGTYNRRAFTYRFLNGTDDLAGDTERQAIRNAFNTWASAARVSFIEINAGDPDFEVEWATGAHGGSGHSAFDGPGSVAAHATYPPLGLMHFDDDETWSLTGGANTDLEHVALHEIGHLLGLDHSSDTNAVMYEFVVNGRIALTANDIERVRRVCPGLMAGLGDKLYLVRNDDLIAMNATQLSAHKTDSGWTNARFICASGSHVYLIRGDNLIAMNANDLRARRSESGWTNARFMTALGDKLYLIRDDDLIAMNAPDLTVHKTDSGWSNARFMAGFGDKLYIVRDNDLIAMNAPSLTAHRTRTGFRRTRAIAGANGRIFALIGDFIWGLHANTLANAERDSGWTDGRCLTALGNRLFLIRNDDLIAINVPQLTAHEIDSGWNLARKLIVGLSDKLYLVRTDDLIAMNAPDLTVHKTDSGWSDF